MTDVRIILPPRADADIPLDAGLVALTEAIYVVSPDKVGGGGMGGPFGYGAEWDSDVFMMHPFCWCERDDCDWCGELGAPNFLHKPSGLTVHWYKWIGRSMEVSNDEGVDIAAMFRECLASTGATDEAIAQMRAKEAQKEEAFFAAMKTPEGQAAWAEFMAASEASMRSILGDKP